ncbi:GNAT family N-acetyltransferase [Parasphingorhabdus pacifica]
MQPALHTERLIVRDWTTNDSDVHAALDLYGTAEVTDWLTPEPATVSGFEAMHAVVHAWTEAQPHVVPPAGRWAVQDRSEGTVVGALVLRLLPPYDHDLELTWQLRPGEWGVGYATESARALLGWAFTHDIDDIYALVRPDNKRAASTAVRIGMTWVGETDKYYDTNLHVYRIRNADL